jgi:hypothetical protein
VSKQAPATLTPERYAARFNAEKAALQRAYCDIFKFWRTCPLKRCRRARTCSGDPGVCLKRHVEAIPRDMQWQARRQILAATSRQAGPPERQARELLPGGLV